MELIHAIDERVLDCGDLALVELLSELSVGLRRRSIERQISISDVNQDRKTLEHVSFQRSSLLKRNIFYTLKALLDVIDSFPYLRIREPEVEALVDLIETMSEYGGPIDETDQWQRWVVMGALDCNVLTLWLGVHSQVHPTS